MADATCPCGNSTTKTTNIGGPKKYCSTQCRVKFLKHGTYNGYKLGCRCSKCRAWKSEKSRLEKRRKRIFVSGQCVNIGCNNWFTTTSLARSRMYCSSKCNDQDKHRRQYAPYRKGQRSNIDVLERREGCKRCFRCQEWLPEYAFNPSTHTSDRLSSRCRRCHSDAQHSLSADHRRRLLEEQDGKCATCEHIFDVHGGGRSGTYAVDHDHRCCPGSHSCGQCIRGLLCTRCNRAIGLLRDDVEVIQAVADYVIAHQSAKQLTLVC